MQNLKNSIYNLYAKPSQFRGGFLFCADLDLYIWTMQKQFAFQYETVDSYKQLSTERVAIISKAIEATKSAYAPYSGFSVGAAIQLANGEVITGSNQENASYPAGLCAERVALNAASHLYPNVEIKSLVVTAAKNSKLIERAVPPCGSCRQVMLEVVNRQKKSFEVLLVGERETIILPDMLYLLPFRFNENFL